VIAQGAKEESTGEAEGSAVLGKYELIAEVAKGGMATVYLCRRSGEAGFSRLFALKVMHPHLASSEDFVSMLLDEAHIAARVHHPNAIGIVDLGSHEGSYFLVMEYVEGTALSGLLRAQKERRPVELLLPIIIDALAGLHAAHILRDEFGASLELIHRDVSPQNILVGIDGVARITDFGIAKAEARITHTAPGIHKGKLVYMSPEQAKGQRLDPRSDVFSMGTVLFEALTGERLFGGDDDAARINNLLNREVPRPSTVGLCPPEYLDEVVLWALERDPDDRPPSAAALGAELRRLALEHGVLGSHGEVGAWVEGVFGERLESRRRLVAGMDSGGGLPAATRNGVLSLPSGSLPLLNGLTPSCVISVAEAPTPAAEERPSRRRRLSFAMGAAACVVAVLVGLWFFGADPFDGPNGINASLAASLEHAARAVAPTDAPPESAAEAEGVAVGDLPEAEAPEEVLPVVSVPVEEATAVTVAVDLPRAETARLASERAELTGVETEPEEREPEELADVAPPEGEWTEGLADEPTALEIAEPSEGDPLPESEPAAEALVGLSPTPPSAVTSTARRSRARLRRRARRPGSLPGAVAGIDSSGVAALGDEPGEAASPASDSGASSEARPAIAAMERNPYYRR